MKILLRLLIVALLAAVPGAALAAAAGQAVGIKPSAGAKLGDDIRVLRVGADVFLGDLVQTGANGQIQILFSDNTELVLGPNSTLRIDDYLLRNNGSAGKLAIDMLSGAFRFATGDSAKNQYAISTPTGTIGIRGTEFDVDVDGDGVTQIIVYDGEVIFCTKSGECRTLSASCEVGVMKTAQAEVIGNARGMTDEERLALRNVFIYAFDQSPLLSDFRVDNARRCLTVIVPPPIPRPDTESPNTGNDDDECGDGGIWTGEGCQYPG